MSFLNVAFFRFKILLINRPLSLVISSVMVLVYSYLIYDSSIDYNGFKNAISIRTTQPKIIDRLTKNKEIYARLCKEHASLGRRILFPDLVDDKEKDSYVYSLVIDDDNNVVFETSSLAKKHSFIIDNCLFNSKFYKYSVPIGVEQMHLVVYSALLEDPVFYTFKAIESKDSTFLLKIFARAMYLSCFLNAFDRILEYKNLFTGEETSFYVLNGLSLLTVYGGVLFSSLLYCVNLIVFCAFASFVVSISNNDLGFSFANLAALFLLFSLYCVVLMSILISFVRKASVFKVAFRFIEILLLSFSNTYQKYFSKYLWFVFPINVHVLIEFLMFNRLTVAALGKPVLHSSILKRAYSVPLYVLLLNTLVSFLFFLVLSYKQYVKRLSQRIYCKSNTSPLSDSEIKANSLDNVCVSLQNVSKHYGEQLILNDVSLNFYTNYIYCILGPNSSGKSTLLSILHGSLKPSLGKIQHLTDSIGYVPQKIQIIKEVSLYENLKFVARFKGINDDELQRFVHFCENDFFITYMKKRISNLSSGEKRKAQIAVALLGFPKLLVLDEPGSGIDKQSKLILFRTLSVMRNNGHCIVLCTHDTLEAMSISDIGIILKEGKVSFLGSMEELRKASNKIVRLEFSKELPSVERVVALSKTCGVSLECIDKVTYLSYRILNLDETTFLRYVTALDAERIAYEVKEEILNGVNLIADKLADKKYVSNVGLDKLDKQEKRTVESRIDEVCLDKIEIPLSKQQNSVRALLSLFRYTRRGFKYAFVWIVFHLSIRFVYSSGNEKNTKEKIIPGTSANVTTSTLGGFRAYELPRVLNTHFSEQEGENRIHQVNGENDPPNSSSIDQKASNDELQGISQGVYSQKNASYSLVELSYSALNPLSLNLHCNEAFKSLEERKNTPNYNFYKEKKRFSSFKSKNAVPYFLFFTGLEKLYELLATLLETCNTLFKSTGVKKELQEILFLTWSFIGTLSLLTSCHVACGNLPLDGASLLAYATNREVWLMIVGCSLFLFVTSRIVPTSIHSGIVSLSKVLFLFKNEIKENFVKFTTNDNETKNNVISSNLSSLDSSLLIRALDALCTLLPFSTGIVPRKATLTCYTDKSKAPLDCLTGYLRENNSSVVFWCIMGVIVSLLMINSYVFVVQVVQRKSASSKSVNQEAELAFKSRGEHALTSLAVSKYYGLVRSKIGVENVSVNIEIGTVNLLLGKNGAGKTSLLKTISGIYLPSSGVCYFNKKNVHKQLRLNTVKYCDEEDLVLDESMTIKQHFKTIGGLCGYGQTDLNSYCAYVSKALYFEEHLNKTISVLSTGTRRKVTFALFLLGNFSACIVDEPIKGLDPETQSSIWAILKKFSKNRAVFVASHDTLNVFGICKVYVINEGRLVAVCDKDSFRHRYCNEYIVRLYTKSTEGLLDELFTKETDYMVYKLKEGVYSVSIKGMSYSQLYYKLLESKLDKKIEDFELKTQGIEEAYDYIRAEC